MAHITKYRQSAAGHLLKHYSRESENISNPNIKTERTELNRNLAPQHGMSDYEFLCKRKKEVKCHNRKDVNVMCDWVVTVPKDLENRYNRRFFECVYDFLCEKYNEENVISAWVHYDEVTPHIHFAFVPVVWDEKKQRNKVCAKELINRQSLKQFHGELSEYLEQQLGFTVNVENGATARQGGNVSAKVLQREYSSLEEQEEALAAALEDVKARKAKISQKQRKSYILGEKSAPINGNRNSRRY